MEKRRGGPASPWKKYPESKPAAARVREPAAREIPAGQFKTHCLELMDEVQARHIELVITKHGRPVAKLVPVEVEKPSAFGSMKGTVTVLGDIVSPDHEAWTMRDDDPL